MTERLPAIELVGVVKRFGSVVALDGASLSVRQGTVHAVLGENGAGKTTLMRVAFGMVHPDAGRLAVHGTPALWRSPADAIQAGIGMVHQHFTLVPAMTVAENVELGADTAGRSWRFSRRVAEERVRELSRTSGLVVDPAARVMHLAVAAQQRVEILKALSRNARILILDEPTAVLAPRESDELLRWLRVYTAAGSGGGGGTAILITHKLREALAVSDDVTVLRRGRTVLTARASEADAELLTRAMIGEEPEEPEEPDAAGEPEAVEARGPTRIAAAAAPPAAAPPASPDRAPAVVVVAADDVVAEDEQRRETVRATFLVRAGEVVGVVGVEGAGQHTLLRVLAGRIRPSAGRLTRPANVGFIPEDRHQEGLVLEFSLAENVALRGAGARRGRVSWPDVRQKTAALMGEFDVRAPSVTAAARTLSGGNQQRLILARELDGHPSLLVAENPTRGLDVRSAAQVHDRLRTAARGAGTAVVLYSSDLDEILAVASRVLAVHAGRVREVAPDRELVGRAMLGLP